MNNCKNNKKSKNNRGHLEWYIVYILKKICCNSSAKNNNRKKYLHSLVELGKNSTVCVDYF